MKNDHKVIYLQVECGTGDYEDEGRLWCEDQINDDDTKYIRADVVEDLVGEIEKQHKIFLTLYEEYKILKQDLLGESPLDTFEEVLKEHEAKK